MFRRTVTALLSIIMLSVLSVVISAQESIYDITFDISSDGKNEISVRQGDVITVDFYMERTDETETFDLRAYQNEIEYDDAFFELKVPDKWNFRYEPSSYYKVHDERTTGQWIVKISERESSGLGPVEWIGSFELKVIAETGSSVVSCSEAIAIDSDGKECAVTEQNLKVTIADNYVVTYSDEIFDSSVTSTTAYSGIDYHGKILDSIYNELYDWTVTYEIDGVVKNAVISENTFTIPGENIVGNIKLDYSKTLNVRIYVEPYAPGLTLVRVEGAKEGYTFAGNRMVKSANSENMGAWVVDGELSIEKAEALIGVAQNESDEITESTDINGDSKTNLNDLAVVLGCSEGYYESATAAEVTRYLLSDIDCDRKVTKSDYTEIVTAYKQS